MSDKTEWKGILLTTEKENDERDQEDNEGASGHQASPFLEGWLKAQLYFCLKLQAHIPLLLN